ncbi:carbohydrate ABC transporter permease [Microbacterium sp. B2969]|uniref:Carbohydrate ABC transporter permease n=1 Tax=Microbacterium alkaliflavum TaxID=3248839 RepID=A0ABW7QA26_9MICO
MTQTAAIGAGVGRRGRTPRGPRRLTAAHRDWIAGYAMTAPVVLGALVFVVLPLGAVFWYSLHDWNVLANSFVFAGFDNFERMLADPGLRSSLLASLWFSIGLVVLNISLALGLAVLLNQKLPGTTTFRTIFFSPVVVSLVAWTIVWGFLLQDDGGINGFLHLLGIDGPNWLRSGPTAMLSVIVVQVFKNVGLNMILFLAALQGVPEDLYEAARLDGAGAWRRFRSITVPLISPSSCSSRSSRSSARWRSSRRSPCSQAAGRAPRRRCSCTTSSSRRSGSTTSATPVRSPCCSSASCSC